MFTYLINKLRKEQEDNFKSIMQTRAKLGTNEIYTEEHFYLFMSQCYRSYLLKLFSNPLRFE